MNCYNEGKIYKLLNERGEVYYGSTCGALWKRLKGHLKDANKTRSKDLLKDSVDIKIELVENFNCNTRRELMEREHYYIKNFNCINKNGKGRTKASCDKWRIANPEKVKIGRSKWYNENKEELKIKSKIYREENKDLLKQKRKAYYQKKKAEKKQP